MTNPASYAQGTASWKQQYNKYMSSDRWSTFETDYYRTHERACAVCGSSSVTLRHHTFARFQREAESDVVPLCQRHSAGVDRYHDSRKTQQSLTLSTQAYVCNHNAASSLVLLSNPSDKVELLEPMTIAERRDRDRAEKRAATRDRRDANRAAKRRRGAQRSHGSSGAYVRRLNGANAQGPYGRSTRPAEVTTRPMTVEDFERNNWRIPEHLSHLIDPPLSV